MLVYIFLFSVCNLKHSQWHFSFCEFQNLYHSITLNNFKNHIEVNILKYILLISYYDSITERIVTGLRNSPCKHGSMEKHFIAHMIK